MNIGALIGSDIIAFIMLWRLAMVGIPFLILLVVPGFLYGRVLMAVARKLREEQSKLSPPSEQFSPLWERAKLDLTSLSLF